LDTGTNISVVKPYVSKGVDARVEYVIRGVTGDVLRTKGSRNIEFQLGGYSYFHNFIIAQFSVKQNGVTSLNLLRGMSVKQDLVTNRLVVVEEEFLFIDMRLCNFTIRRVRFREEPTRNKH
jgi:hypothetical protein